MTWFLLLTSSVRQVQYTLTHLPHRIGVWAHPANEVECPFHPLHELRYGMLRRVVTAIAPWRTLMDSNAAALERRPR